MARRGATQGKEAGRRPGGTATVGQPSRTTSGLERAILTGLALDGALGLALLYVHAKLKASHGTYTSFCNVSERVNCDLVLASAYSTLVGMPIALWALVTYGLLASVVLWRRRATGSARTNATLLVLAIAVWSLVFSLYMAAVAAFVLETFCLLCAAMYVVNALVAVLAWRLARAESGASGPLLTPRRAALGATAIGAALAVVGGSQLATTSASLAHLTPDQVRALDPDFYQWYTSRPVVDELPAGGHVKGPADAPVTIVEFSDFECAYCAKAFRDLSELEREHRGSVRIVFHHFPLDPDCNPSASVRLHRYACLAAIAAECAARGGLFWDYHNRLFADPEGLGREALIATATDLGIDRATFTACLDDPASKASVLQDAAGGARLGVKSTPTLFINGRAVEGALERRAYEYVIAMERRHG